MAVIRKRSQSRLSGHHGWKYPLAADFDGAGQLYQEINQRPHIFRRDKGDFSDLQARKQFLKDTGVPIQGMNRCAFGLVTLAKTYERRAEEAPLMAGVLPQDLMPTLTPAFPVMQKQNGQRSTVRT